MIRIYADGYLVHDSRLEAHGLVGLKVTPGLNVGGTAEIILPVEHPAYDKFVGHRTLVTIQRNGELRFRGRALYSSENIYGQRTVTCEGEMCFLRDSIQRPYSYEDTPRNILSALLQTHNGQLEAYKHFTLGAVTVGTDIVKLESERAETTLNVVNKLLDICGGYIVFTSAEDGRRVLNLDESINRRSGQTIELGENLLSFSRTGANNKDLATGLIPYGAKDEETKKRLTIESVNDGKDYIIAEDAKEVRGIIMSTKTWDDVTDAATLLAKARAHLNERKTFITSLELTALDLSYLDMTLDSFSVGDTVRVKSPPHGVDEDFLLTKMTENLLDPSKSKITLGRDEQSLTGADAKNERNAQNALTSLASASALNAEINARAGVINKIDGVVQIGGGVPVSMLGGTIYIDGSEINFGREIDFPNSCGVRIAKADGSKYYVLQVDTADNCVVGNDYCDLYLRGKDAVYLYKTGAAVTSDQREKNSIERLPDSYMKVLDSITPVRFRFNDRGDQYHVGFVAQDVEKALAANGLDRKDFGGFVDLYGDGTELGLAYDEFIGLLLQKIRKLEKRLEKLEG